MTELSIIPETKRRSSILRGLDLNQEDKFACPQCGRFYKLRSSLRNHQKWECGKEPQFKCPHCPYKAKQKMHIRRHIERMHKIIDFADVRLHVIAQLDESVDKI